MKCKKIIRLEDLPKEKVFLVFSKEYKKEI